MSAHALSQPGIDEVPTNTLLPNVNGMISTNIMPCTAPGVLSSMPTNTDAQQKHSPNTSASPIAISSSTGPVCTRKPMIVATTSSTRMHTTYRTMSARTAPMSGADLAIGMARNRSNTPLETSVFSCTPAVMLACRMFITSTPGTSICRYASVFPASAPPNRYVNITRKMIGAIVTSASCSGFLRIFRMPRQASESPCRTPLSTEMVVMPGSPRSRAFRSAPGRPRRARATAAPARPR